jgi:hypothetical protein
MISHQKLTLLETDHCWQIRVRLGLRIFEFLNKDVFLLLLHFILNRDPVLFNLVGNQPFLTLSLADACQFIIKKVLK